MGGNTSRQLLESTTRIATTIMNDTSTTSHSTQSNLMEISQNTTVKIKDSVITNCPLNISQQSGGFLTVLAYTENNVANEMQLRLISGIANEIQQYVDQLNEGLTLPWDSNDSEQQTIIHNSIENTITNSVRNTFENTLTNILTTNQGITFTMRGVTCNNSSIDVSQEAMIENFSQQIATNAVKNFMESDIGNSIENAISQSATQANIGLSLGGLLLIIIIGVVAFIMFKKFLLKFIIIMAVIAIVLVILFIVLVVTGIIPNPFAPAKEIEY